MTNHEQWKRALAWLGDIKHLTIYDKATWKAIYEGSRPLPWAHYPSRENPGRKPRGFTHRICRRGTGGAVELTKATGYSRPPVALF